MVWPNECHSTPFFQYVILTSEEYLHRATRVSHDVNWTRVLLKQKRWRGCPRYLCHARNLQLQSIARATACSCQSGSYRDLQGQVSSLLHHIASSVSDHPIIQVCSDSVLLEKYRMNRSSKSESRACTSFSKAQQRQSQSNLESPLNHEC